MKTCLHLLGAAALGLCASVPGAAATILQDQTDSSFQIEAYGPMGQSFTALAGRLAEFAFGLAPLNTGFPNEPVTVSIHLGTDIGAAPLATATRLADPNVPSLPHAPLVGFDFDIRLVEGEVYTAVVSVTNVFWGLQTLFADAYPGGGLLFEGDFSDSREAHFMATFAPIPAPASAPLLVAAVAALLAAARRRG